MLWFVRKLVDTLLTPTLWGFSALILGVVLIIFAQTRRMGIRVVCGGAIWLVLLSLGVPFDPVGRALEGRFVPLQNDLLSQYTADAQWVVVLGGGLRADAGLPVPARLNEASLYRVVEGIRLQRSLPGTRLVFTGDGSVGQEASANVIARLALTLGVEPGLIVTDPSPRTTGEEARIVKTLVGDAQVILVTSAVHMERAMRLFTREGVSVIPAPTGQGSFTRRGLLSWIKPSSARLVYADAVAHEVAGLAALRFQ